MGKRRMVVRCYHSSDLSDSEQKTFADDVQSRLDGTGINGYFVTGQGHDWLEWEGESDTVKEKVQQHVDDSRVQDYDVVENTSVSSLNTDQWRGHTDADVHCELL